jgi:hypothetical protein
VVEHLPSKQEALNSNPTTSPFTTKKKKKKERKKKKKKATLGVIKFNPS